MVAAANTTRVRNVSISIPQSPLSTVYVVGFVATS
jgi:hypothetical protein